MTTQNYSYDNTLTFIENLTLEDLNALTEDTINNNIILYCTGFDSLFKNKNTKKVSEDKLVEILEMFRKRSQCLFEYTYYDVLPYGEKVRMWVFENLSERSGLVIEDKENY